MFFAIFLCCNAIPWTVAETFHKTRVPCSDRLYNLKVRLLGLALRLSSDILHDVPETGSAYVLLMNVLKAVASIISMCNFHVIF
jgi:hypothetical protein